MFAGCLLLIALVTRVYGQYGDYCRPQLCTIAGNGKTYPRHVACDAYGFRPRCGDNPQLVDMNGELRVLLLDLHNNARSIVARGESGLPAADRMVQLVWSPELALVASANVKKCRYGHDKCRNTDSCPLSGQNIAEIYGYGYLPDEEAIEKMFKMWFDKELPYLGIPVIESFQPSYSGEVEIGHCTQILNNKAGAVGCALARFDSNSAISYSYMACNYCLTNIDDERVYTIGRPCSGCQAGCSSEYAGLCVPEETEYLPSLPEDYEDYFEENAGQMVEEGGDDNSGETETTTMDVDADSF